MRMADTACRADAVYRAHPGYRDGPTHVSALFQKENDASLLGKDENIQPMQNATAGQNDKQDSAPTGLSPSVVKDRVYVPLAAEVGIGKHANVNGPQAKEYNPVDERGDFVQEVVKNIANASGDAGITNGRPIMQPPSVEAPETNRRYAPKPMAGEGFGQRRHAALPRFKRPASVVSAEDDRSDAQNDQAQERGDEEVSDRQSVGQGEYISAMAK